MIKIKIDITSKAVANLNIYKVSTNIIVSFIYVPAGDVRDEGVVYAVWLPIKTEGTINVQIASALLYNIYVFIIVVKKIYVEYLEESHNSLLNSRKNKSI